VALIGSISKHQCGKRHAAPHPELPINLVKVSLYGALGDVQSPSYVFVRESLYDQRHDLALPWRGRLQVSPTLWHTRLLPLVTIVTH